MGKTNRGFTKAYKKELQSDIWKMPPLYQRVFFYLRQTACWEQEFFPTERKFSIAINPGQIITSLANIADGVSWYKYGVKKVPNRKTIRDILAWLESNAMVTVVSNRYGTFINITNWDTYNILETKKVTQKKQEEVTQKKRNTDTLKEVKEVKDIKKDIKDIKDIYTQKDEKSKIKIPPSLKEVQIYCKERKNNIDPDAFMDHYIQNGWIVGKNKNKMKDWKAAVRTWERNNQNNNLGKEVDEKVKNGVYSKTTAKNLKTLKKWMEKDEG